MPPTSPARVFISYSHDSPTHMDQVLRLSDRLRADGVDCLIDQYEVSPAEGWPTWCMNQVKESEFVLAICNETYERRFSGKQQPGRGKGATFEGYVITQSLYDEQCLNIKFIPAIFSASDSGHIPTILKGSSVYDLSGPKGYERLYRRLTNQPLVTKPELGHVKTMPPQGMAPLPKLQRKQRFRAPVWNVPFAPNPVFTGRMGVLRQVRKKLCSSGRVAISGMHGVGKTQIAAEYTYRYRDHYQTILWARSETRETLVGDFASIARVLDLPQKEERDQAVIVGAVNRWLETNRGWLFVLDNTDDLSRLREFVPSTHYGHLLLTTCAQAFGGLAERVFVEEMSEDEGSLLLLRRAALIGRNAPLKAATRADRKLAHSLTRELGGLPLALDQAGAFIEETPVTLEEYSKLYEKEGKHLRMLRGELSGDHPSVTVTFSLAFSELAKRDPVAADLVRLCAFLAPEAIPEELFTNGASALGQEFARRVESPLDFSATLRHATKFSLVRRDTVDRSLDIHRLVQEVLKDEMAPDLHRVWAERAVRVVESSFPEVEFATWSQCNRLLTHAMACAALIEKFSFDFESAARLLNQTALCMERRSQYGDVESLFKRASIIYEKTLGSLHPTYALTLNNLGCFYDDQGRYFEAETLYGRALTIWENSLGSEHPFVASALNNVALLCKHQRRYGDAEALLKRALDIDERVLGREDPGVAVDLNNLAGVYGEQREYREAEPLYQRALAICEGAFGQEHPDVAHVLGNYAALLRKTGREKEAMPLEFRADAIREKIVKQAMNSLAFGAA